MSRRKSYNHERKDWRGKSYKRGGERVADARRGVGRCGSCGWECDEPGNEYCVPCAGDSRYVRMQEVPIADGQCATCAKCDADDTVTPGLCECRAGPASGRLLEAKPVLRREGPPSAFDVLLDACGYEVGGDDDDG